MAQIANALFPQPHEHSRLLAFKVLSGIALVTISSAIAAIFAFPAVSPDTHQDLQHKLDEIRDTKTVKFPNGDTYSGEWVKDERHGRGKCIYANGDVYDGEWVLGKTHGQGKYTYADGEEYNGEFADDEMRGRGKCIYADGDVYDGEWFDSYWHGQGIYTYDNGDYILGKWHQFDLLEITNSEVSKTLLFATNSMSGTGAYGVCASLYLRRILQTVARIKNEESIILTRVANALEFSATIDATQITSSIKNGNLTIIPAGWNGHLVILVFYKDHLLISNRGQGAKDCSTKIFRICPDLLSVNQINRIIARQQSLYEYKQKVTAGKTTPVKQETLVEIERKTKKSYAKSYDSLGQLSRDMYPWLYMYKKT